MTCLAYAAVMHARYGLKCPVQKKGELVVCHCGRLLRSVNLEGRWQWSHIGPTQNVPEEDPYNNDPRFDNPHWNVRMV